MIIDGHDSLVLGIDENLDDCFDVVYGNDFNQPVVRLIYYYSHWRVIAPMAVKRVNYIA